MRLAIIGAGEMGSWFAKFCKESGWDVVITDINHEKAEETAEKLKIESKSSNAEAVEDADIVLVSVPVKETSRVIREVYGSVDNDSLLLDIASIKEEPVKEMKNINQEIGLASIHPLFGPGAENLENKNIITIPINVNEKYEQFIDFLSEKGADIEKMDEKEHDQTMAVIQSLTHYTLLVYLSALDSMKKSEKAIDIQTPMSKKLMEVSKAFLKENPKICTDIQTDNQYSTNARKAFQEAAHSINEAFKMENIEGIRDLFEVSREKLGMEGIESAYKELYAEEDEE